jgi:hypothetical protein
MARNNEIMSQRDESLTDFISGATVTLSPEDEAYSRNPLRSARRSSSSERSQDKPEHSKRKTIRNSVYASLGVAALFLIPNTVKFVADYNNALQPHIAADGSVIELGKATVEKVSLKMPNIVLATAETKVSGVKVKAGSHLTTVIGNIPLSSYTLTRTATVDTDITINPGDVAIEYDAMKNQLSYTVPDVALSTNVNIPVGEASTIGTSSTFETLPLDIMGKVADAFGGAFGQNGSDTFAIGSASSYASKINNNMTAFADLNIATQVDEVCTPKITAIPHFSDLIKENVKTAIQGELLNPTATSSATNDGLSLLMSKPFAEIQKIAENAKVNMADDYKVGPDQKNVDKLNKFISDKMFTSSLGSKAIKCGIDKNVKLTPVAAAANGASK